MNSGVVIGHPRQWFISSFYLISLEEGGGGESLSIYLSVYLSVCLNVN